MARVGVLQEVGRLHEAELRGVERVGRQEVVLVELYDLQALLYGCWPVALTVLLPDTPLV